MGKAGGKWGGGIPWTTRHARKSCVKEVGYAKLAYSEDVSYAGAILEVQSY